MGTDFLQLFDKRTAEVIIKGDERDLVSVVDLHGRREKTIWQSYWHSAEERFIDFEPTTPNVDRLKTKLDQGTGLNDIKEELLRELCTMRGFLYLDYWGCWVEAFPVEGPPGAVSWETFLAPIRPPRPKEPEPWEVSGSYLLTSENVEAILQSLKRHKDELQIMTQAEIDRVAVWHRFCAKDPGYCVLYQIDF